MTSGSFSNYYENEVNDNASDGKSFKHKTKITGKTEKTCTAQKSTRFQPKTSRSSVNFKK